MILCSQEFPQGSPQGVGTIWWLLDGRYSPSWVFFPEFFLFLELTWGSPAHIGGLQLLIPFLRSSLLGQEFDQYLGDISWSNFVSWCCEVHPRSGKTSWCTTPVAKFWIRPPWIIKDSLDSNYHPGDIFHCCFFPYLESHYYNYFML